MNQHFNINRFGKLFKKEFSERISNILTISAIFSIILIIWWFIAFLIHMTGNPITSGPQSRAVYLLIVIILMVIVSPLILYYRCNHRKKGIDYITLPASFNEKFLSMLIHTLILFPVMIGFSVLATDLIISALNPAVFNGSIIFSNDVLGTQNMPDGVHISVAGKTTLSIITGYFLFLFCNALYKRNKTLKSIISILIFYSVLGLIIGFISYQFLQGEFGYTIIGNTNINITGNPDLFDKIKQVQLFSDIITHGLLPIAAVTGAYFKMKRQQY